MDTSIIAAVRRYSVPAGAAADEIDPGDIVLVPPPNLFYQGRELEPSLQEGFALARRLLDKGRPVRLIAEGATLAGGWPAWTKSEPRLLLTELGAYRDADALTWEKRLRQAIEEWLDVTFAGIFPDGVSPARALYSSACARLFQPLFYAVPYVRGLAGRHPGARFHCADRTWIGLALLERLVSSEGSAARPSRTRRGARLLWPLILGAVITGGVFRAAVGQLRAFYRWTQARAWLRTNRSGPDGRPPDIWLALVPCWGERANQHVLETVAVPALRRDVRLGVLLTTSLDGSSGPGEDPATAPWPMLRHFLPPIRDVVVEQAVLPGSLRELMSVLTAAARGALLITRRLAAQGHVIDSANLRLDLSSELRGLARLIGTDLTVALATGRATEGVLTRYPARAPVVFSALGFVESAAPNAWCQGAGLPTIDFVHGAGADNWTGAPETRASCRAVWTFGDAATVEAHGLRAIVTGVPRLTPPHPANGGAPKRVLILSNYVHDAWLRARYPLRSHQDELLGVVRHLRDHFGPRFEFLWRPHPSDNAEEVQTSLHRCPGLRLSREASLDEDFAWSDLIISTNSSVSIEALLWSRPVFLHVSPTHRHLAEVRAFAPERCFFYASELTVPFAACVDLMDVGDPAALLPESRARAVLHGGIGVPRGDHVFDALSALDVRDRSPRPSAYIG